MKSGTNLILRVLKIVERENLFETKILHLRNYRGEFGEYGELVNLKQMSRRNF